MKFQITRERLIQAIVNQVMEADNNELVDIGERLFKGFLYAPNEEHNTFTLTTNQFKSKLEEYAI